MVITDMEKIQKAMCLEKLACVCYQSLQKLTHNAHAHQQYLFFFQKARHAQDQIKTFSAHWQECQCQKECSMCPDYGIDSLRLSVLGVIETALVIATQKLQVYKDCSKSADTESKESFDKIISYIPKEISFLRKDRQFHRNKDEEPLLVEVFCRQWLVHSAGISA
jgi:hypothetical protein